LAFPRNNVGSSSRLARVPNTFQAIGATLSYKRITIVY
jgi:hypothetical protein